MENTSKTCNFGAAYDRWINPSNKTSALLKALERVNLDEMGLDPEEVLPAVEANDASLLVPSIREQLAQYVTDHLSHVPSRKEKCRRMSAQNIPLKKVKSV